MAKANATPSTARRKKRVAAPKGARRTQQEIRAGLIALQHRMRQGVTLQEVKDDFGVGRSRAMELMNEAAALVGHKVTSSGKRNSLIYSCPDTDPFRVEFDEADVLPALIMLRDATWPLFGSALGSAKRIGPRLAGALDAATQSRVNAIATRIRLRFHPTKTVSEDSFRTIVNAMAAACTIRFGYAKSAHAPTLKSPSERLKLMTPWHAEPWAVFYARRHLYVIVRRLDGDGRNSAVRDKYSVLRTIKLNRMHDPAATGTPFRLPAWFGLDDYLDDSWDVVRFGDQPRSKVVIDLLPAAAENLIDTEWHRSQSVERHRDGSVKLTDDGMVRMSFRVRGFGEVKYWVLGLGSMARVVQPEGLRLAVLHELNQMQARHGA